MEKMNVEWIGWAILGCLLCNLLWQLLCRYVRDKTLQKRHTPLGSPFYTWKNPLGFVQISRTHPGLNRARGDDGCSGGDWGDCGDGDGGD